MGLYINPNGDWSDGCKEVWLNDNGMLVTKDSAMLGVELQKEAGFSIVCLIYNEAWTAAIVCYDERELDRVVAGQDGRRYKWYLVPREKVLAVCPDLPLFESEIELE